MGDRASPPPATPPVEAGRATEVPPELAGIARLVEERFPPVGVTVASHAEDLSLVVYRVMAAYGTYDPRRPDAYRERVTAGSRALRMAEVALLQFTVGLHPAVERVGVYEDLFFVPVWTRDQIVASASPEFYGDRERFRAFVERGLSWRAGPGARG